MYITVYELILLDCITAPTPTPQPPKGNWEELRRVTAEAKSKNSGPPSLVGDHPTILIPVSEKKYLLLEPLPCNLSADTAFQPLIWHSEGLSCQGFSFLEACFVRRHRYVHGSGACRPRFWRGIHVCLLLPLKVLSLSL